MSNYIMEDNHCIITYFLSNREASWVLPFGLLGGFNLFCRFPGSSAIIKTKEYLEC